MQTSKIKEACVMVLAGALSLFSFAPFYLFPLMWISLAIFFVGIGQARHLRQATWRSFLYGFGFYLANVHWVYISLHTYGGMPVPLALFLVSLLSFYLALFPTLTTYLSYRFAFPQAIRILIMLPVLWTLGEWIRGWAFTGFPWSYIGYSQLPLTPLAGFAPIFGIHGVSFLLIFSVALVVWGSYFSKQHFKQSLVGIGCLWGIGLGLCYVEATQPHGKPLIVSVIQGNIPQSLKWQPHMLAQTLETYLKLIQRSTGEVVILPETAIPIFLQYLPIHYLENFRASAAGRTLITGIPTLDASSNGYYNSAVLLSDPTLPVYNKQHLVPFGEYIPLRAVLGWIFNFLRIPLTDFSQGMKKQRPFSVKDQKIAFNICYEDTFADEIIEALPSATLLANISNLAWFDGSVALAQHGQMAQTRALETGRPVLSATNTGLTTLIDHKGQFIARAPIGKEAILTASVQGRSGMTPYAKIGNTGILVLLVVLGLFGATGIWRKQ